MAHIHAQIDFVVSIFPVYKQKVLLCFHKKLNTWLGIGGHIELGELPDEAVIREILEEAGIGPPNLRIVEPPRSQMPKYPAPTTGDHNSRLLLQPWALEVHDFPPLPGHRHCCLVYFAECHSFECHPKADEITALCWFDKDDVLRAAQAEVFLPSIAFYANWALDALRVEAARDET